jgi:hypothetical protein
MGSYGGPNISRDGLVLYLDAANPKSYIGSGTTWTDLTNEKNNGTLTNGPTFNNGNGGSIVFDGVDDNISKNTSINVGQNFSGCVWVYPTTINVRDTIIGNSYPYTSNRGWFFLTATGYLGLVDCFALSIGQDQSNVRSVNNTINRNMWNHLSFTVENGGQTKKLYHNGIEVSYAQNSTTIINIDYSINEFYIGKRYSTTPETWTGNISNVQLYNRVLTSKEILQNYNATKGRFGL